jgi:quercetin dioxygenase-like cupin family protein
VELIRGRADGARCEQRSGTFTGQVWGDPMLKAIDGVVINTVYFSPGGRTHWHKHEGGQVLHVATGEGWVGQRGEPAERVRAGDVVWTSPGEEHWHGASGEAFLVHVAVSLGETEWLDEVSDEDYRSASTDAGTGA